MYGAAFEILKNQQDAEDALQEAFISIAKNFSKISEIKCPPNQGFRCYYYQEHILQYAEKDQPPL